MTTYYVVAHFHYVLVAGSLFSAVCRAFYYWAPKMDRCAWYSECAWASCTSGGR
jgi:heme/copper-type cytochrome/quinol oxidase subunit 1